MAMIAYEQEFRDYLQRQAIVKKYVSNLNAVLNYTDLEEVSPLTVTYALDFNDIERQIVARLQKENADSKPKNYAKNCSSALRKYMHFLDEMSLVQRVWTISPGREGKDFPKDVAEEVISVGWNQLGDLRAYASKEDFKQALVKARPHKSENPNNNALACFNFVYRMRVGDLVFMRGTVKNIVGYGYVEGDYEFDATRESHKNIRKFKWIEIGEWPLEEGANAYKTLTEITSYGELIQTFKRLVGLVEDAILYPDTLSDDEVLLYPEGAKKQVLVNAYERNPAARKACIRHYGAQCTICEFDFEAAYGELGRGFIHVHHLVELSGIGEAYQIDAVKDLRPVCPNCHAMLHKKSKPCYTIEEIKSRMEKR